MQSSQKDLKYYIEQAIASGVPCTLHQAIVLNVIFMLNLNVISASGENYYILGCSWKVFIYLQKLEDIYLSAPNFARSLIIRTLIY